MAGPDDDWTTVGRKKGGRPTQAKAPTTNGPDLSITAEQLRKDFDKKLKVWRASSCRRVLLSMLRKNAPDEGWNFTKAVCLATGSFSTQNLERNRRSLLQLACFVDLVSVVGEGLKLYAQEPMYSPADVAFLSSLSIQTMQMDLTHDAEGNLVPYDPGMGPAKQYFGPSTLVADFFMYKSPAALRDFFEVEHGMYLGPEFNQASFTGNEELLNEKVKFEGMYLKKWMPRYEEEPGVFEGLMVFWPDPGRDEDEREEKSEWSTTYETK